MHRHGGDRHVGGGLDVRNDHVLEIHPIQLVAGKDQHIFDVRLLDVAQILAHCVGRALVPIRVVQRLLSGQHLDESAVERIEGVSRANMAMQADRIELGQHVAAVQPAVDAVRQGNID